LRPIILTEDQCAEYRLPRIPIKESERRKDKFEARFGVGATELDAMEALFPGKMRDIVNEEIRRYLDHGLYRRVSTVRLQLEDRLAQIRNQVHGEHHDEIEELEAQHLKIVADLNDWEADAEETWNKIYDEMAALSPEVSE